ncbi:MAG: FxDxF family PEP-CTERM protein [Rhodocyclaceae bacterium]|nr:FxDxF family PEP-CTERM protein [Rhodocyclaceae bacterium]
MVLNRLVQRTSRILAIAAFALGLTAGNASATTYSIGDLTALGSYSGASGSFAAGASISDAWNFTLSGGSNSFVGLLTSVFTPFTGMISGLSATLYGPGGMAIPWSVILTPGGYGVQYALYGGTLPVGAYSLAVTGTAVHATTYSIDLTAAVPEPGQWLMFFAGIAMIGAMVRRRST